MRKLLILMIVLTMSACVTSAGVAADSNGGGKIKSFCQSKVVTVQEVLYEAVEDNSYLNTMIRQDVGDFVPILFAQSKTENECILLYSVLVELVRTADTGHVDEMTIEMLDQYIELLYVAGIKTKMFEGMLKDPTNWFYIDTDQIVLGKVAVNLKVAHDLLVEIKKGLEELRCE